MGEHLLMQHVVIVGLGYVGLPLANEVSSRGLTVIGYDSDHSVVDGLNAGRSHVDDVADDEVAAMLSRGFSATVDPSVIASADVIVICVPTPLSPNGGPDLAFVEEAATTISQYLQSGQLVVLESTTYPGTTEEVLVPILEESRLNVGSDVFVAFSPERIDPGNQKFGVSNTPKVVGGINEDSTTRATRFYEQFIDEVIPSRGVREAELAKLIENTYRHVNIALMNELVQFCHELDIDLWDAIRCASTKPFGFEAFYPGPGVGGHCIPIDPNYLSHRVKTHLGQPFRFVDLAQEINDAMPAYVARRAQELLNDAGKAVKGSKILLLGVTYKADIADQRESPARYVALALKNLGADLRFHDPYVSNFTFNGHSLDSEQDLNHAAHASDLIILLQAHREYLESDSWPRGISILDTRGLLATPSAQSL